ncbi:Ig-like domain-containing protein [Sanguibacter sp. 4.1]|uniref:Ig-like domain-containing protein n=1 Tax=Sanguibacter biliveldensis TaxID=3030830 RepID=A0AAF0Z7X9_9MICO|nr:Ig-like domain-containing protein [Sanguibacter sp. 4.1]WPF82747.1 Ig-like domain-containing protein [Sanguibacter sp. 4.1]
MRTRRTSAPRSTLHRTSGLRRVAAVALALPLALGALAATALPASAGVSLAHIEHSQQAYAGIPGPATFTCEDTPERPLVEARWDASGQSSGSASPAAPGNGTFSFTTDVTFSIPGTMWTLGLTCDYSSDETDADYANVIVHVEAQKQGTSTVMTLDPARVNPGSAVYATVAVTTADGPATEGSVQFSVDGNQLAGTSELDGAGTTMAVIPGLGTGSHEILAEYSGSGTLASSSSVETVWVKAVPGIDLSVPVSATSAEVVLSATATASSGFGTPTGSVTFFTDQEVALGQAVLVDGHATLSIPGLLLPRDYEIFAVYSGDDDYTGKASAARGLTVVQPPVAQQTTTTLRFSPTPVYSGDPIMATAAVTTTDGTPVTTGTVQFSFKGQDVGSPVGLGTDGTASMPIAWQAAGEYKAAATYTGVETFSGSSTEGQKLTVLQRPQETFKATPTVTLTVPAKISTPKVEVSVAVTGEVIWTLADVTAASPVPSTPTGTVTVRFVKGGTPYTGTLVDGVATFTVDAPAPGTYEVEASYSGDDFYWAASDVAPTVVEAPVVTPPVTPTPDLTGSTTTLAPGEKITLVARGFLPGETVEFVLHSDPVVLGTAEADADGVATLVVALPAGVPAGEHHVEATGMTSLRTAQIPVTVTADVAVVTPPVVTAPVVTVPVAAAPAAAPVVTAPVVAVALPAAPLASTGAELGSTALLVSVLLGSGVLLVVGRRRFGALAG